MKLGTPLWGRTAEDVERQLLGRYPEIPAGCDLDDLRKLEQTMLAISRVLSNPKFRRWQPSIGSATLWDACCEVVRRAIEYLERR